MEERAFYIKCNIDGVLHRLGDVRTSDLVTLPESTETRINPWNGKQSFSVSFDVKPTKELDEFIETQRNLYEWKVSRMAGIFFSRQH